MKTASELGLNERTFGALVNVRDKLRNGKFQHLPQDKLDYANEGGVLRELGRRVLGWFNMGQDYIQVGETCGQVGCIGGWLNIELDGHRCDLPDLMGSDWDEDNPWGKEGDSPLHHLFYPDIDSDHWDDLSPQVAAKAIDYFLETGDSRRAWPKVTGIDPND